MNDSSQTILPRHREGKKPPEAFATLSRRSFLATAPPRFLRDESGSLVVFGLMMLVLMMMVAGISVDLMNFESQRAKIQNTLDSSVLAAANLDQTLDPEAVVRDYFAKAHLSQYLSTVSVDNGLNARTVSATSEISTPTYFMHMMGIDKLQSPASSTAQEKIGNVEISLVLDFSGSMGNNNKADNLKFAAKQFIDTMFNSVEPGKLSISIVPYAAQVNIAPIASQFNLTSEHSYSTCVDFQTSDFDTTALSLTQSLQRTGNFDVWNDWTRYPYSPLFVCPQDSDTTRQIMPLSGDQTALKTYVGKFHRRATPRSTSASNGVQPCSTPACSLWSTA